MSNPRTVRHVLMFGASNLTLGWNAVISELTAFWQCPLNINVCLGMGRSWIGPSRVFWRVLPGIIECGLWNHLPSGPQPVSVMMTDIGNDIVYGYSPGQILDSVEACVDRVRQWAPGCEIIVTRLPMASIRTLGQIRFRVMRFILFAGTTRTLSSILNDAEQVDDGLCKLATTHNLKLIESKVDWYGFDPIHILKAKRAEVFRHYFSHWNRDKTSEATSDTQPQRRSLPKLPVTAVRIVRGKQVLTPQPQMQTEQLTLSAW